MIMMLYVALLPFISMVLAAPLSVRPRANATTISGPACSDGTPVGATTTISQGAGPNGNQKWLNCGVSSSGWKPPQVAIEDVVTVDFDTALAKFSDCKSYGDMFKSAGAKYGVPPIFLLSFGMQESHCNPNSSGEGNLMQLTKDKCQDINCADPEANINKAAEFFQQTYNSNNKNIIQAVGSYNGWSTGMTTAAAEKMGESPSTCTWQNNLDYLQQFFNGWLQGEDAYANNLGTIKNLDKCGNTS